MLDKTTDWSHQKELRIERVGMAFNGIYRCEVKTLTGTVAPLSDSIVVNVRQMALPVIVDTNLNSSKITTGSTWNTGKLYCKATGVPEPQISWFKVIHDKICENVRSINTLIIFQDDEPIESIPKLRDEVIIGKNFIDFKGLSSEYNGRYSCRASNSVGSVEQYVDIEVKKEGNFYN